MSNETQMPTVNNSSTSVLHNSINTNGAGADANRMSQSPQKSWIKFEEKKEASISDNQSEQSQTVTVDMDSEVATIEPSYSVQLTNSAEISNYIPENAAEKQSSPAAKIPPPPVIQRMATKTNNLESNNQNLKSDVNDAKLLQSIPLKDTNATMEMSQSCNHTAKQARSYSEFGF